MTTSEHIAKPTRRPVNGYFSCGPTRKRPGWSPDVLADACLGRSHRSAAGRGKLRHCLALMRQLLDLPTDYLIAIVPGSDTGAVEMAMWSMLGARGVDVLAWEAFGKMWTEDASAQLPLDDLRVYGAPYGKLPDFSVLEDKRDLVLTWNGTASGVKIPDDCWITPTREGLIIVDATSSVFAMPVPIEKLDVVTFSWQKCLGGEAAHGVVILSPKAVARLESYTPAWPIPKVFQLAKNQCLIAEIFDGETINTPSLLCVEDAIDTLEWAASIGGLAALFARVDENFNVIKNWVDAHQGIGFLAEDERTTSPTSMTLNITADWFTANTDVVQSAIVADLIKLLEDEGGIYDIAAYRDAPTGLRIWGGPTVDAADLACLTGWIDWGLQKIQQRSH